MEIKVLGTGCAKCKSLEKVTRKAVDELKLDASVEKVEDIQKIVMKLKERNIGVLITDHNVQETLSITDRTYLLFEGAILREGTAEELAADEMVRKVYLGENFELRIYAKLP